MIKKTFFLFMACLSIVFIFSACGFNTETAEEAITTEVIAGGEDAKATEEIADEEYLSLPDMSVFIAIDFSDASGKEDVEDTMIEMSKEQTAADALQMFAEAEGMEIDIDVNGNVKSIDGVEGDWYCEINGEKAADGGMTSPEDGDDVYWIMK